MPCPGVEGCDKNTGHVLPNELPDLELTSSVFTVSEEPIRPLFSFMRKEGAAEEIQSALPVLWSFVEYLPVEYFSSLVDLSAFIFL